MPRPSTTNTNTRPFAPIPSPPIVTPASELPVVTDSITVGPSRSLLSTPKNPIETTPPALTKLNFNWIDNHAIRYPFPIADDSNETIDVIEYQTTGTLTASFLNAGAMSHTIKLNIHNEDIERIKALVKTSPDFLEENFHWPFDINSIATFTSKENLSAEFDYLYDARGKNPNNVNEDDKMSPSRLNNAIAKLRRDVPTTEQSREAS